MVSDFEGLFVKLLDVLWAVYGMKGNFVICWVTLVCCNYRFDACLIENGCSNLTISI
jgi:hypothetical protein